MARHRVTAVLPRVRVRQWVLSIQEMEKLCTAIAERVQRLLLRRAIEHDEPVGRRAGCATCRGSSPVGS